MKLKVKDRAEATVRLESILRKVEIIAGGFEDNDVDFIKRLLSQIKKYVCVHCGEPIRFAQDEWLHVDLIFVDGPSAVWCDYYDLVNFKKAAPKEEL